MTASTIGQAAEGVMRAGDNLYNGSFRLGAQCARLFAAMHRAGLHHSAMLSTCLELLVEQPQVLPHCAPAAQGAETVGAEVKTGVKQRAVSTPPVT